MNDLAAYTKQVAVSGTGSNVVIHAAVAGKRWVCTYLFIENDSTTTNLTFRSGSTSITGAITFTANDSRTFGDGTGIVMAAREINESFNVNSSGTAANLSGFALIAFVDSQENFA